MLAHSKQILYLHPSKTGGTSVENCLLNHELNTKDPDSLSRDQFIFYGLCYHRDMMHWNYHRLVNELPFLKGWFSFATIRHPYDRVISEWKYQMKGNRKGTSKFHKTGDINGALKNGAIKRHKYEYHWMPQAAYIGPDTKILKLENIEEDWRNLDLGIGDLEHLNASNASRSYELSDESKQIIQDAFPNDFEELGYDR